MINIASPKGLGKSTLSVDEIVHFFKRRRFLTASIVCWLVALGIVIGIVVPQVSAVLATLAKIEAEEKVLEGLKKKTLFLESLANEDYQSAVDTLEAALPETKPIVPLLSSLEALAQDAGVALGKFELLPGAVATNSATAVAPSGASIVPNVYPLPLKMEVSGDFVAMNAFFERLDELLPMVNVASIQFTRINSIKNASESAQYKAEVDLQSLFLYQKSKPALSDAALVPLTEQDKQVIERFASLREQFGAPKAPVAPGGGAIDRNIFE